MTRKNKRASETALKRAHDPKTESSRFERVEAAFEQLVSEIDYGHIPSENVRSAYVRFIRDHKFNVELDDKQPTNKWREAIYVYIECELFRINGGDWVARRNVAGDGHELIMSSRYLDGYKRDDGKIVFFTSGRAGRSN